MNCYWASNATSSINVDYPSLRAIFLPEAYGALAVTSGESQAATTAGN